LKKLFLIISFANLLIANTVFVSFGYLSSANRIYSSEEVGDTGTYTDNATNQALSFSLGIPIIINNSNFKTEPALGYRSYKVDGAQYGAFLFELPLLYTTRILNQKFSFGPDYKIMYHTNILKNGLEYSVDGSTINSAYGFKIFLEYKNIDYFFLYEYLSEPINYFGYDGKILTFGHIEIQGTYFGVGMRWKF
jgi:hypothetical protein